MIAPAGLFERAVTEWLPEPPRVVVLGLGNVLVGDDAFGPYVARTLQARYVMQDGVEVHDIGTPGLDLAPHLAGVEAAIIVDTVKSIAAPGTVSTWSMAQVLAKGPTPRTTPHQPGVVDTLYFLDIQGMAPHELLLVGVSPGRYDTGAPLSDDVRAAVDVAIALVACELERLGVPPILRDDPVDADIWWERTARRRPAVPGDAPNREM
ncbi:MAG TPA: hydrogenase maturation protease [Longimicrobiales bacterium]|nr:hydrogenase maturation protease [Longimicrobiales bacterium]